MAFKVLVFALCFVPWLWHAFASTSLKWNLVTMYDSFNLFNAQNVLCWSVFNGFPEHPHLTKSIIRIEWIKVSFSVTAF